jgi:hypothetical protein
LTVVTTTAYSFATLAADGVRARDLHTTSLALLYTVMMLTSSSVGIILNNTILAA